MGRSPIASIPKAMALCGLLAVGSPPARSDEPPAAKRPNVLFLAVDDLNHWVGYTGANPQTITPSIDRLAGRGVQFTRSDCAVPVCNPVRCPCCCRASTDRSPPPVSPTISLPPGHTPDPALDRNRSTISGSLGSQVAGLGDVALQVVEGESPAIGVCQELPPAAPCRAIRQGPS